MNIHQFIQDLAQKLLRLYENQDTATSNAWWILEEITQKSKTELIRTNNIELTHNQQQQLTNWLDDVIHHKKPLQYVIGHVPFLQLDLAIKPPFLIPRPETEAWCAAIISEIHALQQYPQMILDVGTGSGCIGLALAQAFPLSRVYAVDINPKALELAQHNAQRNGIKNITFIESDLFKSIPKEVSFDLIVSNPPYIAENEWHGLEPSVKLWEDRNALVAPDHGCALIKKIIEQATSFLKPSASLWIEIGYQQGTLVAEYFKNYGFTQVHVIKDLQKHDRVVRGVLWKSY